MRLALRSRLDGGRAASGRLAVEQRRLAASQRLLALAECGELALPFVLYALEHIALEALPRVVELTPALLELTLAPLEHRQPLALALLELAFPLVERKDALPLALLCLALQRGTPLLELGRGVLLPVGELALAPVEIPTNLRDFVGADNLLPASFEGLVSDIFGSLVEEPARPR